MPMRGGASGGPRGGRRPVFLKPEDRGLGWARGEQPCFEDRQLNDAADAPVPNNPYASLSVQQQRARLPIFKNRNHIIYLLEKFQTLIIVGETGCGKSTQVVQYLLESGWGADGKLVGVTQPRRVAVVTLANRVAEERMSVLGHEVGYVVRFDDATSPSTRIKFMTDGILVREIMADPLLTRYSVIMVDEAHERSLYSDIICGLLRKAPFTLSRPARRRLSFEIIVKRADLRVIVASATLDAQVFRHFFNLNDTADASKDTAAALSVEGRMYAVDILYARSALPDYVRATVATVLEIHKTEPTGDVLCFLTGQDEVEAVCQLLREESRSLKNVDKLWVLPMYGALPAREQFKVFDSSPDATRKVVVATNIAEASVTIPGVVYVIDCGFMKFRALNSRTALESLVVVPVSKASAEQRAGRAGRLRPGKAYRLYTEGELDKLRAATVPEMQRSSLAGVILQLKALGIDNVLRFHFLAVRPSRRLATTRAPLQRPSAFAMIRGLDLLCALGALDNDGHLTRPLGDQMAQFPLPPMHAKALMVSGDFGCSEEILSIVAMLQIQDVFTFPTGQRHKAEVSKRRFSVEEGDHLTLLNLFTAFDENRRAQKWCNEHYVNYRGLCRAVNIRDQLSRLIQRYKIPLVSCRRLAGCSETVRRCLVSGFFSNAAKLHHTGTYRTVREDYPLSIYKGSAIMYRKEYPKWIVFNEVLQDSMRDISVIDADWLYELAPDYYEFGTADELAAKRARLNE